MEMSWNLSGLADRVFGWLLGFVRMSLAGIDVELAELATAKAGFGKHSPDGALDEKHGTPLANDAWSLDFLATDVAGEAGINFGRFLGAGEDDLVRIDDDDEVTGVNMGGENRLVLAAKEACSLHSDLAEDLALGIDHIPLALYFVRLGGKRLHVLKIIASNHEVWAKGWGN